MGKSYTTDELTEMVRGFQAACVLIAGAELDIFTSLKEEPADAVSLAHRLQLDPRGTAILLDALTGMDLLEKSARIYSVPPAAAELLAESGGGSMLGTVRHQGNCLRRWAQLAQVVKTGEVDRAKSVSVRGSSEDTISFIRAMHEISGRIAPDLIRSIAPLPFTHLLDLGGASGTWTIPFLRMNPGARATIFDLPEVIPMAEHLVRDPEFTGRVSLVAGNFYSDELPAGADLVWVSAIVHQNSRAENRSMFSKVFRALIAGGNILIRDVVMNESRTAPRMGAFFAVNMLVATPGGGTYTFAELQEDLASAGFTEVRFLRTGEAMDSLILATKQQ